MLDKIIVTVCIVASAICIGSITYDIRRLSDKEIQARAEIMSWIVQTNQIYCND